MRISILLEILVANHYLINLLKSVVDAPKFSSKYELHIGLSYNFSLKCT